MNVFQKLGSLTTRVFCDTQRNISLSTGQDKHGAVRIHALVV